MSGAVSSARRLISGRRRRTLLIFHVVIFMLSPKFIFDLRKCDIKRVIAKPE